MLLHVARLPIPSAAQSYQLGMHQHAESRSNCLHRLNALMSLQGLEQAGMHHRKVPGG